MRTLGGPTTSCWGASVDKPHTRSAAHGYYWVGCGARVEHDHVPPIVCATGSTTVKGKYLFSNLPFYTSCGPRAHFAIKHTYLRNCLLATPCLLIPQRRSIVLASSSMHLFTLHVQLSAFHLYHEDFLEDGGTSSPQTSANRPAITIILWGAVTGTKKHRLSRSPQSIHTVETQTATATPFYSYVLKRRGLSEGGAKEM